MNKNEKVNNKGYSLIELIIVLAIVAVLAGMAGVTVTMIHSAKAKEAATTFDSEVAQLITQSKNMTCTYQDVSKPEYRFALKLYKESDDKYYIQQCFYDTVTKTYVTSDTDSRNDGKGVCLSAYVVVGYTPTTGSNSGSEITITDVPIYVRYSKDGTMTVGIDNETVTGSATTLYVGDGTYSFYKRNGAAVAKEILRANGSHQLK